MTTQMPLPAQPVFVSQLTSRVVWAGANVKFGASTSSSKPFTNQWLFNFTNLPGGLTINTFAGNGQNNQYGNGTYSGDGGAATNAGLNFPRGMALDAAGNLFIADFLNCVIRKVDTNGIITTVAGNGTNETLISGSGEDGPAPNPGDGGAATNISLYNPFGVAVDSFGNLFFSESYDGRKSYIRKVNTNGIITTIAGNGTNGYESLLGDGGAATNAGLYDSSGIAVDNAGNLFIADTRNNRIRKVNTNGIITTIAGNGADGFSGDNSMATNARLYFPYDVAVDISGNLFIADTRNNRIRKVNTNGIITTVAGNGTSGFFGDGHAATNAELSTPFAIAVDNSGNLFIGDTGNSRVREVGTNGIINTIAGNGGATYSGDGVMATNTSLNNPEGVAVDTSSNLFIADTYNQRIRIVINPQLPNTQSPTLSLNNVTAANAGLYQEVISDRFGSATSNIGSLIVATSPLIYQTVPNPDGSLTLNFVCQPASTNLVLATTNLSPPVVWTALSTNLAGADGDWGFTDTNVAAFPAKFYRSLTQ